MFYVITVHLSRELVISYEERIKECDLTTIDTNNWRSNISF